MKGLIIKFFFVGALFCLLFNPAFTFLGGKHSSVFLLPLILFLLNPKIRKDLWLCRNMLIAWTLLFLFVLFRTLLNGEIVFLVSTFMMLIETFLVSYVLVILAKKAKVDFLEMLLIVASIGGCISCLCLFSPSFNDFSKSIQVITNDFLETHTFRGFGIGEGLTFAYAIVLGTICAVGICFIKSYKWFVLFIPIISGATLINARTGFIPIALAITFFLLFERKVKYYGYAFCIAGVLVFLWVSFIEDSVPTGTLMWVLDFFDQAREGTTGSTIATLFSITAWPDNFSEWIIGKGYSVFEPKAGKRTDIGYLIQLCYGGIIYCILLYYMVWSLVKKAYSIMPKALFFTLIISMLYENFKGPFITRSPGFASLVIIMIYFIQLKSVGSYKHTLKS